jgi:hypothetical protein
MSSVHPDPSEVTPALDQIIDLNERTRSFWQERAAGWAPGKAATMLENSRLDRLVPLSYTLRVWTQPCSKAEDFWQAVVRYHEFVTELDARVPYPEAGDYA